MKKLIPISSGIFSAVLTANLHAASIGINFLTAEPGAEDTRVDYLTPGESAGAPGYEQTNWNSRGRWGSSSALIDGTGAASGVTMAWDATGTWGMGPSGVALGSNPNEKLMSGYIDSNGAANVPITNPATVFGDGANKPLVYLQGMTAWMATTGVSSYDVVLYADGDGTNGRIGEYWLQSATGSFDSMTLGSDLTSHYFNNDLANFSGVYDQVAPTSTSLATADSGNYIVFRGVTSDTFLLRTEEAGGGAPFRAPVNGLQIVGVVPEPGMFTLSGLAVLGLLIRRRR